MGKFFIYLYRFLKKRKLLLGVTSLVFLSLLVYSLLNLRTNEDFSALFPREEKFETFNMVLNNSAVADRIIVYVNIKDTANTEKEHILIRQADAISDSLKQNFPVSILDIKYLVTDEELYTLYNFFYDNLPLFLTDNDYKIIEDRIADTSVKTTLKNNLQTLISPAGIAMKQFLLKDPFGFTGLAMEKLKQFQIGDDYVLKNNRIFSNDRNTIFIFLTLDGSSNTRETNAIIGAIEELAGQTINDQTNVQYYGAPVVASANASRVKSDIILTVTLTILLLFIFLSLYFRNYLIPFLLFVPVVFGAGISIIVIYALKGEISAISMGVGSILLGIGIDYSLHFFTHYRRNQGIKTLLKDISLPVFMSSITTAAAFLCLFVINSDVFRDLGLFAAISILSTAFAALVILPLVSGFLKFKITKKSLLSFPETFAAIHLERKKPVLLIILVLTIVFLFTGKQVSFNENLMDMNYMTDELSEAEAFLQGKTDYVMSSVFVVSKGKNLDEALSKTTDVCSRLDDLKENGSINEYYSPSKLIIPEIAQIDRISKWNKFWTNNRDRLTNNLIIDGALLKYRPEAFSSFFELINKKFEPVPIDMFGTLQNGYLADFIIDNPGLSATITMVKMGKDRISLLYNNFEGQENIHVLNRQEVSQYLFSIIKTHFRKLILLSSLLVFLILLLSFGRIELALVSFIPIVLSWVWTLGIMGLFNIQFNFFNVIISTFIFGLGVDYSIFITRGLLQKLQYRKNNLITFKTSILLSAITTVTATFVLIFAQHPAIRSIALVSVIGITSAALISFTIQPWIFNFLTRNKGEYRALPITLFNFFFAIVSLVYFLIASLSTALILIPLVKVIPFTKRTKKRIVHSAMWFFSKTVVYFNVHVPKKLQNINRDTFREPVYIISNHQSTLDLVMLLMLHPRMVILANTMAWKNPFYGPIIRYTEFIYVDEGLDSIAKVVRERMDQGYSVLVFPEGTRSHTGKIRRFHKGAFYIAEKLNLKVQPLMLHGVFEAMSKKEFYLRRSILRIKAFDKIDLKDGTWGKDYHDNTKTILKFYRDEHEKMNIKYRTPDTIKHMLVNRYIYRGPVLEWYLRVKLKLENNYNLINNSVPRNAVVTDIGCGYGFLSTMLALITDKRKVHGIDYDEEKIVTAQHCTDEIKNLSFMTADANAIQMPDSDVFILSDVLHYMSEEKQQLLMLKCFKALNKKGMIIIRDADRDLIKRTRRTRLTEIISTGIGFNKTKEKLIFVSGKMITDFASEHGLTVERIDNTRLTSNITYFLRS